MSGHKNTHSKKLGRFQVVSYPKIVDNNKQKSKKTGKSSKKQRSNSSKPKMVRRAVSKSRSSQQKKSVRTYNFNTPEKSRNLYVNKVNNNHDFVLTSGQKKHILIFTALKEFVKKEIWKFSRVSVASVAKKTKNIRKIDYKKAVGDPNKFKETLSRIEKELSVVLKNQLFDPFNTSTEMTSFTRWKSDNSYKPENRIYRFNPEVLQKLVLSIKEMNTKIIKLVNLRVGLIYKDYKKIRPNKHIEDMSSRIKSTLKNLNENRNISESKLEYLVKNIPELEKYSTDIGRRNERL